MSSKKLKESPKRSYSEVATESSGVETRLQSKKKQRLETSSATSVDSELSTEWESEGTSTSVETHVTFSHVNVGGTMRSFNFGMLSNITPEREEIILLDDSGESDDVKIVPIQGMESGIVEIIEIDDTGDDVIVDDRIFKYPLYPVCEVMIFPHDVKSIAQETDLNENIIDFYMQHLLTEQYRHQLISTRMIICICRMNVDLTKEKAVLTWMKNIKIDLFKKDYIVFPVNYKLHWYLAIICYPSQCFTVGHPDKKPRFLFYNSIKNHQNETFSDSLETFLKLAYMHISGSKHIEFKQKPVTENIKVSQQENDYDCGCYILKFVEMILRENKILEEITVDPTQAAAVRQTIYETLKQLTERWNPSKIEGIPEIKF